MNKEQAKKILVSFRPESDDHKDPLVAEALELTAHDTDLAEWLEEHSARQRALRRKFRSIKAPAGLKEQIISEAAAAATQKPSLPFRFKPMAFAYTGVFAMVCLVSFYLFAHTSEDSKLSLYRQQMVSGALRGYAMDLRSTNMTALQSHLHQNNAPAGFSLPPGLAQARVAGCSVQTWHGATISLLCFQTGRPLPVGQQNDIWLYTVDQKSIKNLKALAQPQFENISHLATATWVQDGKLYLLGVLGDEATLKKYL